MKNKNKIMVALVATLMIVMALCAVAIPNMTEDVDAAPGDSSSDPYIVNILKGQTWIYDTTFPPTLDPMVTIDRQGASFTDTNGTYGSVSDKKVTVAIPLGAASGEYYLVIKAETANPTQVVYQYVKFIIKDNLTASGTSPAIGVVGQAFSWAPTSNASSIGGASWSVTPSLPTGLSINTLTGEISGMPTEAKAAANYTVRVNTTSPAQTTTVTVNITITAVLSVTIPTVYAIEGGGQDAAQVTTNLEGAKTYQITDYGTLQNGSSKVTIDPNGNILVNAISGDAGTHTITVRVTMTDTGQSVTQTFTLVIVQQLGYTSSPSAGYIGVG